eukprot:3094476-Rhodomonas_salina.2
MDTSTAQVSTGRGVATAEMRGAGMPLRLLALPWLVGARTGQAATTHPSTPGRTASERFALSITHSEGCFTLSSARALHSEIVGLTLV